MQPTCFLYLIVAIIWTANGYSGLRNCDHLGVLLYEDLGCKPYYKDGNPCPSQFSCNSFASNNETCLFRGKKYRAGEEVADSLIAENCFFDCKCADPTGYQKYECGIKNCTEWSVKSSSKNCYHQYVVDECCAVGFVCPQTANETYECPFEGTVYREGELFLPSDTCSKCSCRRGFRGIVEEPYCKRNLCATQVVNYEELENYCAPLYLPNPGSTALCCPSEWVCYTGNETMTEITSDVNPISNVPCNFGPKMLSVGTGFTEIFDYFGYDVNVTCQCILPPLMTCTPS